MLPLSDLTGVSLNQHINREMINFIILNTIVNQPSPLAEPFTFK